ncbi:ribonuclease H-like domain-containing protein [Tanacetum coccineum]|uniref:Ribonuclease H-like domain-containing protein n=1 Tax=Tanacetum coccineum TaxID=301880 RepID=A0ABQ4ZB21_9ASTR
MPNQDNTGIFDVAYDDRDEGAEADYNNLEPIISVNPIPSTRENKDHPKDQIIGEVKAMQEELLQFKLLNVWTLVDLPNGKKAIGTKWVFRNKKDQRGIMVKNKAMMVA